jgi:hypothetical protein
VTPADFEVLAAGVAMFAFVFLKAFQQRNVAFDHYLPVIPTSWLMAICEVYVIAVIVKVGYDPAMVFAIGTGSGIGAVCAMWLHRRVFTKKFNPVKDLFYND